MKTTIWITTSFTGFHCWPKAPDICAHLRTVHRHKFNVRLELAVSHADRDVEFHTVKSCVLDPYLWHRVTPMMAFVNEASLSCEMLAQMIYEEMKANDYTVVSVAVDEDGECGATIAL